MSELARTGQPPLLVVLSGPSGAGKDAVLIRMKAMGIPFHYVVTATTRPQRRGETHGVDYLFMSDGEFSRMRDRNELLEAAEVYGYWYGVPKSQVKDALDQGKDVMLKIDVQGAATIRRLIPQSVHIFLTLPSLNEYEQRLRQRKTESETQLKVRLGEVFAEMKSLPLFDYIVVNRQGELDSAVSRITAIVTAEKCRVNPRGAEFSF